MFLRAAETAAAAKRHRDAESALIAACRQSELASDSPSVPLARVLSRLGDHYVAAAGRVGDPQLRENLMARARDVLSLSADAYATALGPNASTTRSARQRLRDLDDALVAAGDLAAGEPEARATKRGAPSAARLAQSRPQAPERDAKPVQARELAVKEDSPELQRLASDLARLRAQAEAVSDDLVGLRLRAEAARAQKDQCQDASCLQEWYARRRRELLAEF